MGRTKLLQEILKLRFLEAYGEWHAGRPTQAEAGLVLGMYERNFRRYPARYKADGLEGLIYRRLEQVSNRCAPLDVVMALTREYQTRHSG